MAECDIPSELVGFGTLLQYYDKLAGEWVSLAGTNDLAFPDDMTDAIEATSNPTAAGLAGRYRKRIPSPLSSLEPVEYEMNFLWNQWQAITNMKAAKTITEWRLVLMNPQQTFLKFCAWISKLGGSIPMEDLVKSTVELTPTGAPEWGQLIA